MKVSLLKQRSKRRCVLLLGIYLAISGAFLVFLYQNRIPGYIKLPSSIMTTSFDQRAVSQSKKEIPMFDGHFAGIVDEKVKYIDLNNQTGNKSGPCFSQHGIQIDDNLKVRLDEKHMLSYFKIDSQYVLSVPKWQQNLGIRKPTNGTKFYITSIVRVRLYADDPARWTPREFLQWLHYQFWAGAEHVYVCNHFLNDNEKLEPFLAKYIKHGLVTLYPWSNITYIPHKGGDNTKNQVSCYNYILKHHGNEAVWHYNFDMDENPYVPGDRCEGFLTRYLKSVDSRVSELKLANFVLEGQGDRTRDIFYDRINRITPKPLNPNVKPIYRVAMTTAAGMHSAVTTGRSIHPMYNEMTLLHYWGARTQNWMNDTEEMLRSTVEFNDVRNTIAINIRHSLIAFGEFHAFASNTGP